MLFTILAFSPENTKTFPIIIFPENTKTFPIISGKTQKHLHFFPENTEISYFSGKNI
jgi:hypothetical protein